MNSITASPATPTAAQYRAAAASSLRQAIWWREESRRRYVLFDRRVDRRVMRSYALDWRRYTALATLGGAAA